MARVNVGIDPIYISDQHLLAESVEITMITGSLKHNNNIIKTPVPEQFCLGTGHINFFKNKIVYLKNRLISVNNELIKRNFKPTTFIDLNEYPLELLNNWKPDINDSMIVRDRISERLINPKSGKALHRYQNLKITDMDYFINNMNLSDLHYV